MSEVYIQTNSLEHALSGFECDDCLELSKNSLEYRPADLHKPKWSIGSLFPFNAYPFNFWMDDKT